MKHILITIIAAVLVVGCGESQQSTPAPEPQTAKAPDISIHEAAIKGNIEAVKQHIAAGTDLNAKYLRDGYQGGTPLYYAVNANKEIVELLLANGADVNAKDNTGLTPLHRASAKDDTGLTPLTEALTKEIVELLITNGADVNAKAIDPATPLDMAIIRERTDMATLLRKHGGKSGAEDSIFIAASVGNTEAVKEHLASGADVNAKSMDGYTPLYVATLLGHKQIAELLITNGADVNAKNKNGDTPIDFAVRGNQTATIDLLRKHGGKTREELKAEGK